MRRDHKAKVQQLRSLESVGEKFTSRTMEDLTKMVRAVKAIDAGVRLNPQALSSRVRGQGDELWDSFVESSNKFYDCVDRIEVACIPFEAILQRLLEIARETRLGNNLPDVFRREFVEAISGRLPVTNWAAGALVGASVSWILRGRVGLG